MFIDGSSLMYLHIKLLASVNKVFLYISAIAYKYYV